MEGLGENIKKLLLAGIGAVAVTAEKSKDVLEDLVEKGELTVEQGKALNEELKHNIKKTVKEKVNVSVKPSSPEEIDELLEKMTPEQLQSLKARIDAMNEAAEEKDKEDVQEASERRKSVRKQNRMQRAMGRDESQEYKTRLREITDVLRKHNITRGLTPEKFRLILEDLGPTFIKLGQIMSMHSDILPKRYCDELMRLRSEVSPMPFAEVTAVLEEAYGCSWNRIFQEIDKTPLGSASIAQVHRAVLKVEVMWL